MKAEQFKEVVQEQFTLCCDLLNLKETIYSDGKDRLVQFKTAAVLDKVSPVDALKGMMVKHTTKLYQMFDDMRNDEKLFDEAQWNEVLSDHINYHFLLRALLIDEGLI